MMPLAEAMARARQDALRQAGEETGWCTSKMARGLGTHRNTVLRYLADAGISAQAERRRHRARKIAANMRDANMHSVDGAGYAARGAGTGTGKRTGTRTLAEWLGRNGESG